MEKKQSQNLVKDVFQNSFDKTKFIRFIRELLNSYEEAPFVYRGNTIPDAYDQYINTFERVGKYSDGENSIDILIVYLKKGSTLERARTRQRNFIAWYLNGSRGGKQKDVALVAFVSPDSTDWRFSLVKMEYKFTENKSGKTKIKEEFTPAKRWSFLVGSNENSHTAQSRLAPIVEDDSHNPLLKQLEEAFNIEKVTKEFFEKYRDLFLRVYDTLNDVIKKHPDIKTDFAEKNVNTVDFSKKLLGQIVFLYFLQKKGWFGVKKGAVWGTGSKQFLRDLFDEKIITYKNFFNDILEPLFYDALARDRSDIDHWNDHFQSKIPFLNGGLFDPINNYDWVNTAIDLPNDIFSNTRKTKDGDIGDGILDIFDRYNFTVKEDEPLEKEVAIDPEMLGKVFENLLEVKDRKSKGTYYTPREIVHYMCEQSLVNYLATELEGKVLKEDLEKLIKIGENVVESEATYISKKEDNPEYKGDYKPNLSASIEKFAKEIDGKLANIKVCDPAIGSGAFPVGMMNAIVKARMVLSSYLKEKNRTLYTFKRDCIQNSLYGVDIDPGAVEIAKLRLWLSLVVDEDNIKQIKPLPNLDYKIMQGNSLLEEFEGIKLFDEKLIAVIDNSKEKQLESLKQKQAILQKEYFELHSQNKLTSIRQAELDSELKKLQVQVKGLNGPEKITTEKVGLFDIYSEAKKKADDLKRLHKEFFEATQKSKKDNIKKQIEQLEWELIEVTLKEQGKTSALKKLEEFKRSNTKPFFLWKLNFADVFEEKGGFDVVIANPPYVGYNEAAKRGEQLFKDIKNKNILLNNYYNFNLHSIPNNPKKYAPKPNLYAFFIARSTALMKTSGAFCFIIPQTILVAGDLDVLRFKISNEFVIQEIVTFTDNVFDNRGLGRNHDVATSSLLLMLQNKKPENNFVKVVSLTADEGKNRKIYGVNYIQDEYKQEVLIEEVRNWALIKWNPKTKKLIEKVIKNSISCSVYYDHQLAQQTFNSHFYFDKGLVFKKTKIIAENKAIGVFYHQIKLDKNLLVAKLTDKVVEKKYINFPHGSQGEIVLQQKYKIVWGYMNFNHFYYSDENVIIDFNFVIIASNNNEEIKFLFSLLNSKLIIFLFNKYLRLENEKNILLGIKSIKEYLRIPTTNDSTLTCKNTVISLADKIIKINKLNSYIEDSTKRAEVRNLENQIDELVYKLYNLTDEEIEIVENSSKK